MMGVIVIVPPVAIASPSDVPGGHSSNDPLVKLLIDAAQGHIDGPTGWLGRSLGVQTLEWSGDCWPSLLPYGPILDVESIQYTRVDGSVLTLPPSALETPEALPSASLIRIRYRAGYDDPPAQAKAAVVLMTMGLMATSEANGGLRSFEVQGAFTRQFNSPELMARVRSQAVENLLQPLRVYQ